MVVNIPKKCLLPYFLKFINLVVNFWQFHHVNLSNLIEANEFQVSNTKTSTFAAIPEIID